MVNIRVHRFHKLDRESGNNYKLLGFADVELQDEANTPMFAIRGVKLMQNLETNDTFVAYPSEKGKDNKYREFIFPLTAAIRAEVIKQVTDFAAENWDK